MTTPMIMDLYNHYGNENVVIWTGDLELWKSTANKIASKLNSGYYTASLLFWGDDLANWAKVRTRDIMSHKCAPGVTYAAVFQCINHAPNPKGSTMDVNETLEERGNTYGKFTNQARITQNLMSELETSVQSVHGRRFHNHFSHSQREALHMIMNKIARLVNGDPNHLDSWHDIAGYAQLIVRELEE